MTDSVRRHFLEALARSLKLPAELVSHLDAQVARHLGV